eukprot:8836474-Lingulodinium_polyedra.AAC.1
MPPSWGWTPLWRAHPRMCRHAGPAARPMWTLPSSPGGRAAGSPATTGWGSTPCAGTTWPGAGGSPAAATSP